MFTYEDMTPAEVQDLANKLGRNKADLVADAVAGDLAGLDAWGNLVDSGVAASDVLTKSGMDSAPTLGATGTTVTSDGIAQAIAAATPSDYEQVKQQVETNKNDIADIEELIPEQASENNQLADKNFVNSSIATNTATFRGTYNLVSDLGLTISATEQQVAAAIATKLDSLQPPVVPENNDYCFVQVPTADATPTEISRVDRYKCTVTESGGTETRTWEYEFSLNNSSFTAAQWAAINSGITSGDVSKLAGIAAGAQVNVIETVKVNGTALTPTDKAVDVPVPVQSVNSKTGAVTLTASDVGAIGKAGTQTLYGTLTISDYLYIGDSAIGGTPTIIAGGKIYIDPGTAEQGVINIPLKAGTTNTLAFLSDTMRFSVEASYAVGDVVFYNGAFYRCKTAHTAGAWNASHFAEVIGGLSTGTPTAPTPTAGDDSTKVATTAFVQDAIPSWAKASTKPSYTLNEVCPEVENWLGVPGTTAAGKSIKVLAKTVNGVIEGGVTVTGSSNNDNNATRYRYGGVAVTRNGVATDYLFDGSESGIARLSNLRYDMPTAVALVAENDEATLVCADRAVTNATIAAGFSTLNLTFPEAISGKVRDFYLRIVVAAGESAPALSIPSGITIENPDGAVPEIADGETDAASTTLVWFSETAPNVFTAKSETVKAVA